GRRPPRRPGVRALGRRAEAARRPDRPGPQEGEAIMSRWPDPAATGVEAVLSLLLDSSVKGALVLGVAALVALGRRRGSASSRHLAWTLGLAAMLALPPLSAA